MSTLAYPSADFPGQPSVALEVPDGWEPAHVPGTSLAARLPREGSFAPNVVVTVEQCEPSLVIEDSLQQITALATSRGGGVSEPYAADLGGARFVGCDATWPDADVETVLQANLFHLVSAGAPGAPAHLVQLTGAVGGADAVDDYELIRAVLTTARVTPWSDAGAAGGADVDAAVDADLDAVVDA